MRRGYLFGAAGLAVLLAAGLGWWFWPAGSEDRFAPCRGSAIAGGGTLGGPFELVDQTGRTRTEADLVTMPTILYFGYTFCPDVCPLDNARNAAAVDLLEARGIIAQPAFISVDPARDTLEHLADFAANLHPRMVALTGTEAQVRAAAQAYRVVYAPEPATDGFYLISHSTHSYLLLPGYGYVDFLPRALSPEQMADRVACFVSRA